MDGSAAHVARGHGVLERYLAKKAVTAGRLMSVGSGKGRILDIGCGMYPYFLLSSSFTEKHGIDQCVDEKPFKPLEAQNIYIRKFDCQNAICPMRTATLT